MAQNFANWNITNDILEPVKAPINPYRDVGILIDLSDEKNKPNDIKLSGSDLDNLKKQNFDLIDLYENFYATPQHLMKQEKDIDYDQLFQTVETEEKIDCSTNPSTSKEFLLNNIIDDVDGQYSEYENEEAQSIQTPIHHIIHNNLDIPRVLKVPQVNELKCEIDDIQKKIENSIGNNINMKVGQRIDIQKPEKFAIGYNLTANFENANKLKALAKAKEHKPSNNDIVSMLNNSFKDMHFNKLSEFPIQNRISRNFGSVNDMNYTKFIVKTVTLDKKTYNKIRQARPEVEKLGFTKGPDIYEKSVVLPQIMKRLSEREAAVLEESKVRRKLVLDTGKRLEPNCSTTKPLNEMTAKVKITKPSIQLSKASSSQVTPNKEVRLNPIIAMENCNRERLIAHRVHSAFEKYVLTGSYY